MHRRGFCMGALAAACAAGFGRAHPDHRDGALVIDVLIVREGDRVDVAMRTPLELLSGVGLPLIGDHDVDPVAFRRPDPIVGDGRTYEARAVAATLRAFRLEQGGVETPLEAKAVRLAPEDVAGPLERGWSGIGAVPEPARPVDARHGYLDIHFAGPARDGAVSFAPTLGPGSGVAFRVAAGRDAEPVTLPPGAEPARLAP